MKKLLAALTAGVMLSASVFGLTGCGEVGIPKGEKVTKEAWAEAFEESKEHDNYTLNASNKMKSVIKGTVLVVTSSTKIEEREISYTATKNGSETVLYNKGSKAYREYFAKAEIKGKTDGVENFEYSNGELKEYYELSKDIDNVKLYWEANTNTEETRTENSRVWTEQNLRQNWNARETNSFVSNFSQMYNKSFYYDYDGEDITKAKSGNLAGLYEQFEYANGVYTATLYTQVRFNYENLYYSISEYLPCKVTLRFEKGAIIGYGVKIDADGVAEKKDSYKVTYDYTSEEAYALSDIGNTDPARKVTKDITKALDKAKAEKEENN